MPFSRVRGLVAILLTFAFLLVLSASVFHPLATLGLVADGRPEPSGPLRVVVTDISVSLRTPLSRPGSAPVGVRLWYSAEGREAAPLLLYLPTWGAARDDNAVLCAELASHGFVVAAIDDIAFDPPVFDVKPGDAAVRASVFDIGTDASRERVMTVVGPRIDIEVSKVLALLDALDAPIPSWPHNAQIDKQQIGVFGASFGGAAAAEATQGDPRHRLRAVVNLDGWLQGTAITHPLDVPFAEFNSVRGMPALTEVTSHNAMRKFFARILVREAAIVNRQLATRADSIRVAVKGANHSDFFDALYQADRWTQWRPWRQRMMAPWRVRQIIDTYVVAFFKASLMHQPSSLLQQPSPFPEVVFEAGRTG